MRYTVDVTAGSLLAPDINTLESDEDVIQAHLDKIFPALFKRLLRRLPYWRWFPDRRLERDMSGAARGGGGLHRAGAARMGPMRSAQPDRGDDRGARQPEGGLTDADVAGNVLTMLLAGEDTTANTLAWMIYLLHRHPDALAGRARKSSECDLTSTRASRRFPFVDACINETMRLKPVAPIIMLQPTRDTEIAGVEVPKKTLIMCLMRAGAIDERRFPDAQAFDPRAGSPAPAASPKRVSMPFGAGPRLCPGRYLAILEMKMVMAMLLSQLRDRERRHARRGRGARAPRLHDGAGRAAPQAKRRRGFSSPRSIRVTISASLAWLGARTPT